LIFISESDLPDMRVAFLSMITRWQAE